MGVVFKYLKLVELNVRPDELAEREQYLKTGVRPDGSIFRPQSSLSEESKNSQDSQEQDAKES